MRIRVKPAPEHGCLANRVSREVKLVNTVTSMPRLVLALAWGSRRESKANTAVLQQCGNRRRGRDLMHANAKQQGGAKQLGSIDGLTGHTVQQITATRT